MRHDFEFHFAQGGSEALELLAGQQVDIVVSDMRMPVLSGLQFLQQVQNMYPQSIRIMLSGQADDESIVSTVSVVHQFLAKPCEPDKLKDVLVRGAALYNLLGNDHLRAMVSALGNLPSLPSVFAELNTALTNSEVSPDEVAKIIEKDMAMTAKVLQLVNSSFFGLYQKVESTSRAVKLLGIETIKVLVLGAQIFSQASVRSPLISVERLYDHSMAVANCCRLLARQASEDQGWIEQCFIAGLLHDLGKLLLISKCQEQYEQVLAEASRSNVHLSAVESLRLQATHGQVGAYLIGLWGFISDIIEAVAFHNCLDGYPASGLSAAAVVHIADHSYYRVFTEDVSGAPPVLNEAWLTGKGLLDEARELVGAAEAYYRKIESS